MTPRRTRSGKILSQDAPGEGSVARTTGVGSRSRQRGTSVSRPTRVRATATRRNRGNRNDTPIEEEVNNAIQTNEVEGLIDGGEELIVEEAIEATEVVAEEVVDGGEELTVEEAVIVDGPVEENGELSQVGIHNVEDETIEILRETVNESVIDLTDDTPEVVSPLSLGGHWINTPTYMARIPPNPMFFTPRPVPPPITVDLTDSPVPSANLRLDVTVETTNPDLDSTASPAGGGISVQCPVCLESLGSIKRSGANMVSTVCGHIFCSRCLPASLRASGRCPSCRKKIGGGDYHKIFI